MWALAFALFLRSWLSVADWDGHEDNPKRDIDVDDMPDVPPQLGR